MLRSLPSEIPLRSLLLAIADQIDGMCFVVRDYGILVTTTERAWSLPGATIPAEVPFRAGEGAAE
jgi:hypothetical protein